MVSEYKSAKSLSSVARGQEIMFKLIDGERTEFSHSINT